MVASTSTIGKAPRKARKSQDERSAEMRKRLAVATLDLLSEVGVKQISTTMISKRAGVSNGALMHHFATKEDLLVKAFEFLLQSWEQDRLAFKADHSKPVEIGLYLRYLWENVFSRPNYVAAIELMLAARGDAELRARLQSILTGWVKVRDAIWSDVIGFDTNDADRGSFLHLNLCVLRGMAIHGSFNRDSGVNEKLLETWIDTARIVLKLNQKKRVWVSAP